MKKSAIIIDLDGTLADISHRRHHVEDGNKNWKAFYNGITRDDINVWCHAIIDRFSDDNEVLLVTGRPEPYRDITRAWLDRYHISYSGLFMRPDKDYRKDFVIKQEIYDNYIKDSFDILFAIDDRQQVVDMWRRNDITCLQCAEGDL